MNPMFVYYETLWIGGSGNMILQLLFLFTPLELFSIASSTLTSNWLHNKTHDFFFQFAISKLFLAIFLLEQNKNEKTSLFLFLLLW